MCLREHVLDLLARFDVPVRNSAGLHLLNVFRPLLDLACRNLTLTYAFHDVESVLVGKSPVDKARHDGVTASDNGVKIARTVSDEILCVSGPYIGTV